ncbi:MAG TPA: nodulation protein NfeD, partial [Candidatus Dormibacteraeota bacterium]|nr:nodulation protein NfeD [Candidatus Dormibacteraeota bacterium]
MKRLAAIALAAIATALAFATLGASPPAESGKPQVDVLTLEGAIQPISAEVFRQAIDRAEKEKREALIVRLDTPGGLDTSMREIIK